MTRVSIVDYGIGNLFSVRRALETVGADVTFAENAEQVLAAPRLVLPGVGAFADGMQGLRDRNLCDALKEFAGSGRPLLGICLGMQMLLSRSEEFGEHEGLGIIPGRVLPIPSTTIDGGPHKIPHIGWSRLDQPAALSSWAGTILAAIPADATVYLVHSYTAAPDDARHRLADCTYNGRLISAAIRAGNVYGCQFHPEKSGSVGLRILDEFMRLSSPHDGG